MKNITIGRDDSCDIIVNNERVSRFHASIVQEGNGYIYRDTSSNGTLINGIMIRSSERFIHAGDQVLLAGNIPLPWNKIQSLAPTAYGPNQYSGNGGGYNQERTNNPPSERGYYESPVKYNSGLVFIILSYIFIVPSCYGTFFTFILSLALAQYKQLIYSYVILIICVYIVNVTASIFSFILIISKQTVNGEQVNKYRPSSVTNGWVILSIYCFISIIFTIILILVH